MIPSINSGVVLDAWRDPQREYRIALERWQVYEPVQGQFIERPRSVRMVFNYLRRIGLVAVARKIRSRLAERQRNEKIAGVGVGWVLEGPDHTGITRGERVLFFAPNHSLRWSRIVVDARCVVPLREIPVGQVATITPSLPAPLLAWVGWSSYSGVALDGATVQRALRTVRSGDANDERLSMPLADSHERVEREKRPTKRPTAVVVGLGNYSKTQIVPCIRRHLDLSAVHEIDPDQLVNANDLGATLDTSPEPRSGERYDAWFIAGYHHTHGPLAVRALADGAYAVVEKPIVTSRFQLDALREAARSTEKSRLFLCFHKRYSRLDEWARSDLGTALGAPVDMHAIVYEIPLPRLHWYNWPNSGSRLISNGCHWLDYFLYVNDFSAVRDFDVQPMRGSDLLTRVSLVNGAQLVLSLTDTGSQRLGVRDVIELRASNVTVRLLDATFYEAENTARVLRRGRVNSMEAYRRMYETICRRIVAGERGDGPESLASTELMLGLEDLLVARRAASSTLTESLGTPVGALIHEANPSKSQDWGDRGR